jgi:hypothetical protein
MTSRSGGLVGAQRPRHVHVPAAVSSAGEEAVELARMAGLFLIRGRSSCLPRR